MWAVSTRTGDSGVEVHPLPWCSLWLRGCYWEKPAGFLSAAFGRTSCPVALSMPGVGEDVPVTHREMGKAPRTLCLHCFSSLIPHQPSSGKDVAEWEQQSDMGDESVKGWGSSYAAKLMIGLVDLKKQLKKSWQFESTESNEWMNGLEELFGSCFPCLCKATTKMFNGAERWQIKTR